jgi:hypothetical protein
MVLNLPPDFTVDLVDRGPRAQFVDDAVCMTIEPVYQSSVLLGVRVVEKDGLYLVVVQVAGVPAHTVGSQRKTK